jgi:signal transduction histidine kinase
VSWLLAGIAAVLGGLLGLVARRLSTAQQQIRRLRQELASQEEATETLDRLSHRSRVETLGELVATLVHELNQPVTAILANCGAGLRSLRAVPPQLDDLDDVLQDISREGERGKNIILRLKEMVRRAEVEFSEVDLSVTARQALTLLEVEAARRGIGIVAELTEPLALVAGDAVQLEQVVMNLVMNGLDAISAGDGTGAVEVTTHNDGDWVELSVSDTGIGLGDMGSDLPFEPFISTKPHGLGIGLSLARTIADSHGGSISARNNLGPGATFSIRLPALPARGT